jgi:spermidine/putrescine transport system ATP-binding protein
MFEGALTVDEPDHAVVTTPDLPEPVFLDHGVTGGAGTTVWLALRPEKIELHKRTPGGAAPALGDAPEGYNSAAGVIRQQTYLGSETQFDIALENGRQVRAVRSNLTRWDQEEFAVGEAVWVAWHACSPAVLLN